MPRSSQKDLRGQGRGSDMFCGFKISCSCLKRKLKSCSWQDNQTFCIVWQENLTLTVDMQASVSVFFSGVSQPVNCMAGGPPANSKLDSTLGAGSTKRSKQSRTSPGRQGHTEHGCNIALSPNNHGCANWPYLKGNCYWRDFSKSNALQNQQKFKKP